ncbi:hypothetical protein ABZT26_02895 [Streptomyces sp. NPDC005395]|uniref:hypothetical protein n=1 Tax=unclassified Streptomyces TaxID=2593676 RepID=UPI001F445A79|nr:hypothetical protein [Streptomyces sp. BSE6.1]
MDAVTTSTVFAKAASADYWIKTNLGLTAYVNEAGYTYTVRLPKEGFGKAFIAGRSGYGGCELFDLEATWAQTLPIVERAQSATRI